MAIARNQTWILASHVLVYARGLILLPVLIKTLGPGVYGSLILLLATAEVIYGISSLGLDYRFCREMPSTTGRTAKRALFYGQFWPHALLVLVAITLILAASSTGFSILPEVDAGWLIALLLVANFCYDKLTDYLGYTDRQGWLAVALTAAPYLNIAIVLVSLLLTQVTLSHLVWISAAVQIATALPILVLLLTEIGVTVRLPAISELSGNVRLGFPLVCAYMVDFILGTSDRFVIAHFMGPEAVGYYSPAYALGSLIILVPKALGIVLPPALSREFDAGNLEQVDKVVNAALQAYLTIAIPFILCAIVVGKDVLTLFANESIGATGGKLIPVVAFGTLFFGLNLILANVLFVYRRTGLMFRLTLGAAVLNLVLNVVLIDRARDIGIAAATTLISYAVVFAILSIAIRPYLKLRLNWGHILRVFLASAATAIALAGLLQILDGAAGLIAACVLAGATYVGCVVRFGIYEPHELLGLIYTERMGTGKEVSERVLCILTCHNRRETTLRAVRQIAENAARPDILVVDDGSTDGTSEALNSEWPEVEVIEGSGELYWGGGMRRAIDAFLADDQAYLLWLNDDVDLVPDALTMSLDELRTVGADVLVGCCVDHTGALSYSGETRVSSLKPVSFARSEPGAEPDTFNGNFVLFKRAVVESVGNIDPAFPHRMGDYDYGLRTARAGFRMRVASKPIGVCERNQTAGSFLDTTLPRRERLKHMLSVKGMPPGPWFTFCIRHARWLGPLVFIKPYLNIIFRR